MKPDQLALLHNDVSVLLLPSRARALMLNKAYRAIVAEQSFVLGRDTTVTPSENVQKQVEQNQPTGVKTPISGP